MKTHAPDLSTHRGHKAGKEDFRAISKQATMGLQSRTRQNASLPFLALTLFFALRAFADTNVPPRLTVLGLETNGLVEMELVSPENVVCHVQATTNLVDWTTVSTHVMRENITYLSAPAFTNGLSCYYRVMLDTNALMAAVLDPLAEKETQLAAQPETAKVIYGDDDRRDLYQVADERMKAWAASVCGLIYTNELHQRSDGKIQILTGAFEINGLPPCPDERFGAQPTAPFCTGFLVGDDLVATAGHCFEEDDIGTVSFVFGFTMTAPGVPVRIVQSSQVYQGVQVVGREFTADRDYAIVRLDRKVTAPGAVPLAIRRNGSPRTGTRLGVIGHPSELPLKLAFGELTTVRGVPSPNFFQANLDTYGGNSGSPVFNAIDGVVEGILVRGETDYEMGDGCFRSNRLPNREGAEDVTTSSIFASFVPNLPVTPPPATIVWVDFAYAGTERGTQSQPYRTIGRASNAALAGSVIRIKAGTTREPIVLSKPLLLEAFGGVVRING